VGYEVHREFYYNDAGAQIEQLARSVQARLQGIGPEDALFPADGYRGDYILDIAKAYQAGQSVAARQCEAVRAKADPLDLEAIRQFAVTYLRHEQDLDLQAFGLAFDVYFLESSLYRDGAVDAVVQQLKEKGHCYEHDGALWLRSSDFGDDKDRVMRKRDGSYTYFVPDVAYHRHKWGRGFDRAINIQGSDHHGTVARVRAGLQALDEGIGVDFPDYVLHKMVTVMRGGQEVKISKRAGSYVSLRDLMDWSGDGDAQRGRDAVRFFLVSRRADSEFQFDVDLALSRSDDNPVYYVQYAHARICSVLRQAQQQFNWQAVGVDVRSLAGFGIEKLSSERELALFALLARWPGQIQEAAEQLAPHAMAYYLRELASAFHAWYNADRFLVDDQILREARLLLLGCVGQLLRQGLSLLGVSAPESM
jgi:arginyl-tRNA synthetase